MKTIFKIFYVFLFFITFTACKPDPVLPINMPFEKGIFITNEGVYGQSSGTITFYNPDSNIIQQDIFRQINGRDLGNIVQSLFFFNNKAYIVVNNSNKIEVADAGDFKELAQITNLEQPRYFLAVDSNTAFVSQWGLNLLDGSVAVLDLRNNTIQQIIKNQIGKGPEQMLLHNNIVYVTNVGGLHFDNFISLIDVSSKTVTDTIKTFDAPNSIQYSNNLIWVACSGKTVYSNFPEIDTFSSSPGGILAIDPFSRQIVHQITFPKGKGAKRLKSSESGSELYFLYDNSICILNSSTAQWQAIIAGNFYGLGFDSAKNYIYASRYNGIQASKIIRFNAANGVAIDSFTAGLFANDFYFRR
jgi:YVTN family beta-propeller protein